MTTDTKTAAARAMAQDLADEAAALAMVADEVVAYLRCGESEEGDALAALGTLTTAQAHLDAIGVAFTATKALLMSARGGRGSR